MVFMGQASGIGILVISNYAGVAEMSFLKVELLVKSGRWQVHNGIWMDGWMD